MIEINNIQVYGFEGAIRGMRNPMNSWDKSDSGYCGRDLLRNCRTCVHINTDYPACYSDFVVCRNDYVLRSKERRVGKESNYRW